MTHHDAFGSLPRHKACWFSAGLLVATLTSASVAAAETHATLLPTLVATEPGESLHQPVATEQSEAEHLSNTLDQLLGEAIQDLDLILDLDACTNCEERDVAAPALIAGASKGWVFSPRLTGSAGNLELTIVAVAPGSNVVLTRSEPIEAATLEVRAMQLMRDLHGAVSPPPHGPLAARSPAATEVIDEPRSNGRAILALNGAIMGGYVGYSLQRAGGSEDPRLTFPLITLGTAIGLGSSMLVAAEWDISFGEAWFLSAGMLWPTTAGLLMSDGADVQPESDRFVYGLIGAAGGLSLATVAIAVSDIDQDAAVMAHSGGAFGTHFGALAQLFVEGPVDNRPTLGMGLGAGAGVLAAGLLSTEWARPSASRMLFIDLAAGLGALTGAAAASPFLISQVQSGKRDRAFIASIGAGTLIGGTIGALMTVNEDAQARTPRLRGMLPYLNTNGRDVTAGLSGAW